MSLTDWAGVPRRAAGHAALIMVGAAHMAGASLQIIDILHICRIGAESANRACPYVLSRLVHCSSQVSFCLSLVAKQSSYPLPVGKALRCINFDFSDISSRYLLCNS
jgi:hypothetical protein